jgi:hypothetical protein
VGLLTFYILQREINTTTKQSITYTIGTIKSAPIVAPGNAAFTPVKIKEEIVAKNEQPRATYSITRKEQHSEGIVTPEREQPRINIAHIEEKPEEKTTTIEYTIASAEKKKPIKLVFSLPAIGSKNEIPEQNVALAEQKKNTLQKIMETTNDLRTGEALGSLLEAKNELFAREFKKEKTTKQ